MFQQIMVPLDGSELAERALPCAERLGVATGATLHLVHVVELAPPLTWPFAPEYLPGSVGSNSSTTTANRPNDKPRTTQAPTERRLRAARRPEPTGNTKNQNHITSNATAMSPVLSLPRPSSDIKIQLCHGVAVVDLGELARS